MARLSRPFLGIKPQPGFSCSLADNRKPTSSPAIPRLPLVHYPCQARGRLAVARCGSASLSVGPSGDFSSSNQRSPLFRLLWLQQRLRLVEKNASYVLVNFSWMVTVQLVCMPNFRVRTCRRDLRVQQVSCFLQYSIRPS